MTMFGEIHFGRPPGDPLKLKLGQTNSEFIELHRIREHKIHSTIKLGDVKEWLVFDSLL